MITIVESGFVPSGSAISDQVLLGRLQEGDETALGALYERHAPLLYSLAVRVVGDRQLAQEVIQDTFLRCWDQAEHYDPTRGRVLAWLIGVTRNRAIDLLRSRSHQARLGSATRCPPPGAPVSPGSRTTARVCCCVGPSVRRSRPCPTPSGEPSSSRTTAA